MSTSGEIWTAGAMPRLDSFMQPSMIRRPSARAAWIIRNASRMPPDLVSLMLTPSPRPMPPRRRAACGSSRRARSGSELHPHELLVGLRRRGGQRLLDQLDVERDQLGADVAGELDRPGLVGVDPDQRVRRFAANGPHPLQVVRAADLDLQRVVAGRPPGPVGRPLHRVDADRVGRGRDRLPVEPEIRHSGWPHSFLIRPKSAERSRTAAISPAKLADPAEHRRHRERILAQSAAARSEPDRPGLGSPSRSSGASSP